MSKLSSPKPPADLIERTKGIAADLGLHWDGLGGAHREQLDDGRSVWRVHDEWLGTGGSAMFDESGELLSIEVTPPERDPPAPPLPARLVPEDNELIAFAQAKLTAIGWEMPPEVEVTRDDATKGWRVRSRVAAAGISVELGGRRGNLQVVSVRRG